MTPEIYAAGITALGAMFAAVSVVVIQKLTIGRDIRETKEQVKNSHGTNLRMDLDSMHESIRTTLRAIEGLRSDIGQERDERLALSNRLDQHVKNCSQAA